MFRFLLIPLLIIGVSVGSYAQDRLSFNIDSIKRVKDTLGGDEAKLKVLIISKNSNGDKSKLDVVNNRVIKAPLHRKIKLERNDGASIYLDGGTVEVSIIVLNEGDDSKLAELAITAIGMIAESSAITYVTKLTKKTWVGLVGGKIAGLASEYTTRQAIEYLEDNEVGRATIKIRKGRNNWYHKSTVSSQGNTLKISYKTLLAEDKKKRSSSSTIQSSSTSKWITPNDNICKNNGGKVSKNGCEADIYDGKKICNALGGRLPSIDELVEVAMTCGVEIVTIDSKNNSKKARLNIDNISYQNCYQKKSFSRGVYWSSDSLYRREEKRFKLFVMRGAFINYQDSLDEHLIKCIRK